VCLEYINDFTKMFCGMIPTKQNVITNSQVWENL